MTRSEPSLWSRFCLDSGTRIPLHPFKCGSSGNGHLSHHFYMQEKLTHRELWEKILDSLLQTLLTCLTDVDPYFPRCHCCSSSHRCTTPAAHPRCRCPPSCLLLRAYVGSPSLCQWPSSSLCRRSSPLLKPRGGPNLSPHRSKPIINFFRSNH